MTDAFLDIRNVSAEYGGHEVISEITLNVCAGETYGLVGLNGAGKTTLLKTILGLKDQSCGTITVAGHPSGGADAKKNLAFLPERFDPAWFLNAYEFIAFSLSLYGRKASRKDIDAMAAKLGLQKEFLPKRAQTYSKGMRQKLGLMTTFMTGCPLLILDEPMSGLDPLARAQVKDIIAEAREQGRTTFLSSHILSDMEELCDRIAVLHEGRIAFIGKPGDLIAQSGQLQLERAFLSLIHPPASEAA
ncbi:MAG TPA: ABC transporter ATP-binding protein [Micavibrio sp.]|nr:ABC transporter ATP-binding protein [Micavibrio sp.]